MVTKLLTAAGLAVLVAAAQPAEQDILGPIGPVPAPRPDWRPTRKTVAVALASGFGVLSVYLTRRRRRHRRALSPSPPRDPLPPGDDLLDLPDGEFYAVLFRASKEALQSRGATAAMTPSELSGVGGPDAVGRDWSGFCSRVEEALYAAGETEPAQRKADLRLVQELARHREEGGNGV